jgi:hypothetical protein
MKQETKKASKVVNAVELSTNQKDSIHNAVNYQLEVIQMDNIYNQDRASLKKLLHENIAIAMTDEPSYTSWNYIHDVFRGEVCKATGMEFESFDKNIWADITKNLELEFELVKPKSPNVKSEQKSEQRAKIDAMTDEELRLAGKIVELAKREEKRFKNAEKLENQSKKDFTKDFKTSMETLSKNEYAFALWIDSNINMLREQFLDSQS